LGGSREFRPLASTAKVATPTRQDLAKAKLKTLYSNYRHYLWADIFRSDRQHSETP
jgi:hypothetical protein